VAGVLSRDQLNFAQDPFRPQGNIFQVADRRGDDIKVAHPAIVAEVAYSLAWDLRFELRVYSSTSPSYAVRPFTRSTG